MNQRDKLKEQKKRLQDYQNSNQGVMYAESYSVEGSSFITFTMWKDSPTIMILKTLQNINSLYSLLLKRILANFYYSVRHITILLSGVKRSRMKLCGSDSVRLGR